MAEPAGDDIFDAPPAIEGEFCDIYFGEYGPRPAALKVARDGNEPLLMNEALTVTAMLRGADSKFPPYLPVLMNTVSQGDRLVTVMEPLDGFSMTEKVRDVYPDGIDPRDMAWMFRRLLVVLGFVHRAGFVHGAVTPKHVMIQPEDHGLVLVDWCHAVEIGNSLDLLSKDFLRWYQPEIAGGGEALAYVDVLMAAQLAIWLIGGDPFKWTLPTGIDAAYRAFFQAIAKARDTEASVGTGELAWYVLKHFDDMLERLYGPKKFRPFTLTVS